MPILVTELLANQKFKATKYNAALSLSLLLQIANATGVQGNLLANVAERVYNVDSNNEAITLITTKINARQTRRASLKLVEVMNIKAYAKKKRNRPLHNEPG